MKGRVCFISPCRTHLCDSACHSPCVSEAILAYCHCCDCTCSGGSVLKRCHQTDDRVLIVTLGFSSSKKKKWGQYQLSHMVCCRRHHRLGWTYLPAETFCWAVLVVTGSWWGKLWRQAPKIMSLLCPFLCPVLLSSGHHIAEHPFHKSPLPR